MVREVATVKDKEKSKVWENKESTEMAGKSAVGKETRMKESMRLSDCHERSQKWSVNCQGGGRGVQLPRRTYQSQEATKNKQLM